MTDFNVAFMPPVALRTIFFAFLQIGTPCVRHGDPVEADLTGDRARLAHGRGKQRGAGDAALPRTDHGGFHRLCGLPVAGRARGAAGNPGL